MKIINGDAIDELKNMADGSVDSLVTDPPAGISFMGKDWDSAKDFIYNMTEIYKECLRVLKPGSYGLVWAIPRTSHWTASALEQAGFEIRDVITHIFGSGFPKSLDVSKAIDKMYGVEGEIVSKNPAYRERQLEHDAQWPTPMRPEFKRGAGSEDAKKWEGFGTALKPASEHWILVRKPLSEPTVAKNVLKHGTGGLNIDSSRINYTSEDRLRHNEPSSQKEYHSENVNIKFKARIVGKDMGRFPANLVLSHNEDCQDGCTEGCPVKMLDEQSLAGGMHSAGKYRDPGTAVQTGTGGISSYQTGQNPRNGVRIGDTGGASRFFYCAKASKKDRGEDNKHPTVKSTKLMEYLIKLITPPAGTVLDPFMGSGSTGVAAKRLGFGFVGIEKETEYFKIAAKRISCQ